MKKWKIKITKNKKQIKNFFSYYRFFMKNKNKTKLKCRKNVEKMSKKWEKIEKNGKNGKNIIKKN